MPKAEGTVATVTVCFDLFDYTDIRELFRSRSFLSSNQGAHIYDWELPTYLLALSPLKERGVLRSSLFILITSLAIPPLSNGPSN